MMQERKRLQARVLLEGDRCIQCGSCLAVCPVFLTAGADRYIGPRQIIGSVARTPHQFEVNEDLAFLCSACGACTDACAMDIPIEETIREIRSEIVEGGRFARTHKDALESTHKYGNPWGLPRGERIAWRNGLPVKDLSKGEHADTLLFIGCTPAYDTRCQDIAKSVVNILNGAKVDFGILGTDESCCGSPLRWIGEMGMFEELKQKNTETFEKYRVSKIVTISPHCYDMLKTYYNLTGVKIQHYTEFLCELVDAEKVRPMKKLNLTVTYQDPCVLGRKHVIFDEPRRILKSIPGVDLVEMESSREDSFCCGGGGGRMWIDIPARERVSIVRAREATKTDPDVLVTSCPFCLLQLRDAILVIGEKHIKVKDIAEIIRESL